MQAYACVLAFVLVRRGHVSQHKILVTLSNGAFSQQLRAALQAGVFKLMWLWHILGRVFKSGPSEKLEAVYSELHVWPREMTHGLLTAPSMSRFCSRSCNATRHSDAPTKSIRHHFPISSLRCLPRQARLAGLGSLLGYGYGLTIFLGGRVRRKLIAPRKDKLRQWSKKPLQQNNSKSSSLSRCLTLWTTSLWCVSPYPQW